jgi:hypothetical protein
MYHHREKKEKKEKEYVSSSGSGVGRNPVTTPAAELTKPSVTSISKSKEA